ncbi:PLP-dependent aminotransferase family protein [Timonella sp. A28]|uniref:MocR-like pyridoxine biosynthesis transcription factor PdxR n=1 Tax=Timonella sp. A28 TaxID=3442640 RepID=UPI003EBDED52
MLPIVIHPEQPDSLAVQIAREIRALVARGGLKPNESVPSTRTLAQQLNVSRGTVVAAYDQLVAESFLVATPGGKTRVHPFALVQDPDVLAGAAQAHTRAGIAREQLVRNDVKQRVSDDAHEGKAAVNDVSGTAIDMTPHVHPRAVIDDSAWREAWRRSATPEDSSVSVGTENSQGLMELREAIAEHLRLMRSMVVDPHDVFVTTGARDGLSLVLSALPQSNRTVAVENPGYSGLRRVMTRIGSSIVEAPVDEHGVLPAEIPHTAHAVLVTPNHLYPVGGAMPAPRRLELLAWAREKNLLVIEDDLDSEYRHVGAVMPSVWELDPQHVVHVGTFNQVLTPEARMGYLIAPDFMHAELRAARSDMGSGASAIAQRSVAHYLRGGGLRRHIIRRRRDVLRRQELVMAQLQGLNVHLLAGANVIVPVADHDMSLRLIARCAERGVKVGDLAEYWNNAEGLPEAGIVLSYTDIPLDVLGDAVKRVGEVVRDMHAGEIGSFRSH